jgi:guanine nucleotide-binding protein subunit alpha
MGVCCSTNSASTSANKLVEAQLKLDNEKYRREIKLLLLGKYYNIIYIKIKY